MSRRRPGDWMCSNCNFLIWASKSSCKKCGARKPGAAAASKPAIAKSGRRGRGSKKGGDWSCASCSFSNFASRNQCKKCSSARPVDEAKQNNANSIQQQEAKHSEGSIPSGQKVDLDVVFIMDCTGSMGSHIGAGKSTIKTIMHDLKRDQQAHINTLNFGYIAYRDQPKCERSFITKVFPLTNDVDTAKGYVDSYAATGGGDGPEALTEALHDSVHKMQYNDGHVKVNILICDAPGHGWGCTNYDQYPDGNPNGYDPIQVCYEMAQRGIVLYVLGCEPSLSRYGTARDILEGLCKITEGFYLPLTNADLLPDMICNAIKQEASLKQVENQVLDIMFDFRCEGQVAPNSQQESSVVADGDTLLKQMDVSSVKRMKIEYRLHAANVYDGAYDHSNVSMIQSTFDDKSKQNLSYVKKHMMLHLKQPGLRRFKTKSSKFAMKSGDWNCTKCHYHNFANRWFCRTCKHRNHTLRDGDWFCESCEDINYGKNKLCRKCKKTTKPELSADNPLIMVRSKEESKEEEQKVGLSSCLVGDDVLQVVMNRIKKQHKYHDWKCKSCMYVNFEANEACRRCGVTKSDNFGDWKCAKCTFMNFGLRQACRECNAPKK